MFFSLFFYVSQSHTGEHRRKDTGKINVLLQIWHASIYSSHCVTLDCRSSVWCYSTGDRTKVRLTFSRAAQGMCKQSSVSTVHQITNLFVLYIDSLC